MIQLHAHRKAISEAADDSRPTCTTPDDLLGLALIISQIEGKNVMKRFISASTLGLVLVTLLGLNRTALAGAPLPFKGSMEGLHVSRTPLDPPRFFDVFEATGQATQLGAFEMVIETVVNFGTRPVTGAGTVTFTAANGDTLVADISGSSALVVPGLVLITEHAIIDPDRSTGRFAGATGTFTLERLADAATGVTGVTEGSFEGTISLATRVNP